MDSGRAEAFVIGRAGSVALNLVVVEHWLVVFWPYLTRVDVAVVVVVAAE